MKLNICIKAVKFAILFMFICLPFNSLAQSGDNYNMEGGYGIIYDNMNNDLSDKEIQQFGDIKNLIDNLQNSVEALIGNAENVIGLMRLVRETIPLGISTDLARTFVNLIEEVEIDNDMVCVNRGVLETTIDDLIDITRELVENYVQATKE